MSKYPKSAIGLIEEVVYPEKVVDAIKEYRSHHIWKIPLKEKISYTKKLFYELCKIYKIDGNIVFRIDETADDSFRSFCSGVTVVLVGKFSVITFLHEFGHLLGGDETEAVRWSINLFKKIFPRSFSQLTESGHLLLKTK